MAARPTIPTVDASRYHLKPLINDPDEPRTPRLEIDEFIADNDALNLFLLALRAMHKDPLREVHVKRKGSAHTRLEPDYLNYYNLGAIHWQPMENWDGVPNNPKDGYCHHGKITFPLWHRPYIALFEMAVHNNMVEIAGQFPAEYKHKYEEAAARFRLPYWDPIMPRTTRDEDGLPNTVWGIPEILKAEKVYVRLPSEPKKFTKVENPLYSFKFPSEDEYVKKRTIQRKHLKMPGYNTVRTARRPRYTMGRQSDNQFLDLTIQRQASDLATMLWQMLHPDLVRHAGNPDGTKDQGTVKDKSTKEGHYHGGNKADTTPKSAALGAWSAFSTHNVEGIDDGTSGVFYPTVSLEHWHDLVHEFVGQGENAEGARDMKDFVDATGKAKDDEYASMGQMGDPKYAGFEPIFWLHHNNIDRLLSLWQAAFPKEWAEVVGTKGIGMEGPLKPFRKDAKDFYTAQDSIVKDYWAPGFAIPGDHELKDDEKTANQVAEEVRKYITKTYWWAANNDTEAIESEEGQESTFPWPKTKNVNGCQALWGNNADEAETSTTIQTIELQGEIPKLSTRTICFHHHEAGEKAGEVHSNTVAEKAQNITDNLPLGALDGEKMYTWNAHVRVLKYHFGGPFSVHLFLGEIEDDLPMLWLTKKNEVGLLSVFAAEGDTSECANCEEQKASKTVYEGVIPLTTKLHEYLSSIDGSDQLIKGDGKKTIDDLTEEEVKPFLEEQLGWRLVDLKSKALRDPKNKAELEIVVTSRTMEPPSEEHAMGTYGLVTPHLVLSQGGGFQDLNAWKTMAEKYQNYQTRTG